MALNYTENNVRLQKSQHFSHLNVYKSLLRLRRAGGALREGDFTSIALDRDILIYKREAPHAGPKRDAIIVILNLGTNSKVVNVTAAFEKLSPRLEVLIASTHASVIHGDVVDTQRVEIQGDVGLVLRNI